MSDIKENPWKENDIPSEEIEVEGDVTASLAEEKEGTVDTSAEKEPNDQEVSDAETETNDIVVGTQNEVNGDQTENPLPESTPTLDEQTQTTSDSGEIDSEEMQEKSEGKPEEQPEEEPEEETEEATEGKKPKTETEEKPEDQKVIEDNHEHKVETVSADKTAMDKEQTESLATEVSKDETAGQEEILSVPNIQQIQGGGEEDEEKPNTQKASDPIVPEIEKTKAEVDTEAPIEAKPKGHNYKASQSLSLLDLPPLSTPLPKGGLIFGLCVVDFNHLRGPEIEYWIDDTTTSKNHSEKISQFSTIWPQLPFQALPDGAHLFDETFSNFTLVYNEESGTEVTLPKEEQGEEQSNANGSLVTLFGCACIRQLDATMVKNLRNPKEVTRSVIQKSVVLITRYPITIQLKEKLSIITATYFSQHDFEDRSLIDALYENISSTYNKNGIFVEDDDIYEFDATIKRSDSSSAIRIKESDFYMGFNLKSLVLTFKRDLMVLFKAILLERRILFFSKDLHKLSNIQYSLLSLIPNLIFNLQDSAYPLLNSLSQNTFKPTSLKSSDRNSMLRFLGLPMHILDKGGFFQPYLALQQLEYLTNPNTKWYIVGTSNDLLLDQKKKFADIVVHIDDGKVELLDISLKQKLALTSQDKMFIDLIVTEVTRNSAGEPPLSANEEENLSETINNNIAMDSKTYSGGDDFVRWSFEDYLVGLLSTVKYDNFLKHANETQLQSISVVDQPDQIDMFNSKFIEFWKTTHNYRIFDHSSDDELFNFFEPKHQMGTESNGFADKFFKWSSGAGKLRIKNSSSSTSAEQKEGLAAPSATSSAPAPLNAFTSFFEGFQKKNRSKANVSTEKENSEAAGEESSSSDSAIVVSKEDAPASDEVAELSEKSEPNLEEDKQTPDPEPIAITKPINKFFNNAWSTISNLQKK